MTHYTQHTRYTLHTQIIRIIVGIPAFLPAAGRRGDDFPYSGTLTLYQNFFLRSSTSSMWMCLSSVYALTPSMPSYLPMPDCLYPPNGTKSFNKCHSLIQTVPARSCSAPEL